jgi:hypothetical protein
MEINLPAERDVDAWQVAIWNLPNDVVSRPQKLQFMLMLERRFNNFEPFVVVGDLLRRRDLWRGVVMDRACFVPAPGEDGREPQLVIDLIKLRDIGSGHWNVDTLFILTDSQRDAEWDRLMSTWSADEVGGIEGEEAEAALGVCPLPAGTKIRTVWWD